MTDGHHIRIKRCTAGDEDALSLVGQATFLETFAGILGGRDLVTHCMQAHAAPLYRRWLDDPDYGVWLVGQQPDDAPVGFMVAGPAQLPVPLLEGDLELKRIYLLGKCQGGGLGQRLLAIARQHAIDAGARRLLLGVYAHNQTAIGFYARHGFVPLGTRTFDVGGTGYDDIVMGLALADEGTTGQSTPRHAGAIDA
ncbi:GNAT family N-acetyltransferase [Luteimonas abyssi]|uniref:GNAT family N-acetyltransferase n=1 Tax=Luteimonas abyssi TaxID=1247514 RepID=UPI000737BD8C|nr:GNAT family N-acetyltransferase [Luteimonas abyssi]